MMKRHQRDGGDIVRNQNNQRGVSSERNRAYQIVVNIDDQKQIIS